MSDLAVVEVGTEGLGLDTRLGTEDVETSKWALPLRSLPCAGESHRAEWFQVRVSQQQPAAQESSPPTAFRHILKTSSNETIS